MSQFRHTATGEIVIAVPNGDYERQLRGGSTYEELTLEQLREHLGDEDFAKLPESVRQGTAPEEHPKVPRAERPSEQRADAAGADKAESTKPDKASGTPKGS